MTHVNFVAPLPGLAARSFELAEVDGSQGLFKLTAPAGATRMYAVDPSRYVPGYSPKVGVSDLARIGAGEHTEPLVLLVVNPSGGSLTVNLTAPILVNPATGDSVQVILEDASLSVNADLAALAP